jgi:hypothetical protein
MEQFKTRQKAEDGIRVSLALPDGTPSDDWLQVRHVWSDAFVQAEDKAKAEIAEWLAAESVKRKLTDGDMPADMRKALSERTRENRLDMLASLVAGWSFEQECTVEAAREFLADAPQIAAQIDGLAGSNQAFFANGSTSLTNGSEPKSD